MPRRRLIFPAALKFFGGEIHTDHENFHHRKSPLVWFGIE
jgi:hypothetical protein